MSTQTSGFPSILFSITTPQQNLRLLELPLDLLELITADNKPEKLYLKSSLPSNATTKPATEYLHLCTDTKVWAIKQVSTSNSVHVIQPTSSSTSSTSSFSSSTSSTSNSSTHSSLTSISLPTSHLELLPLNPPTQQITQQIHHLVPTHPSPPNNLPLASLHSHLPYPPATLAPLIRQCLVFSPRPHTSTYRPSHTLQLTAWKALVNTATSMGVDLVTSDVEGLEELVGLVGEEVEEAEVVECVLRAVVERFSHGVKLGGEEGGNSNSQTQGRLEGEELVLWVGELIVRSKKEGVVGREELLEAWTAMVPREWEGLCDVDRLVEWGAGMRVDGDCVRFVDPALEESVVASKQVGKAGAEKRKWHERFAAQRSK